MMLDRRAFLAIAASSLLPIPRGVARLDGDGDDAILEAIIGIRDKTKLPGLTAAIVKPGSPLRLAATGLRKEGSPQAFTSGDLVHLGSCTKAMTATMIATLVEEGKLAWTSTLAKVFPNATIHEGYREVTFTQLLTHRAGLPANGSWWTLGSEKSTTDQRRELLRQVLIKPPRSKPGSEMFYSNVGYAMASLMAETVTGLSWEDLMRERLFEPLQMSTAGFGAPGALGKVEQPWGHTRLLGKLIPNQKDNAPALGPAGTVHCSMADWAKFIELHLRGGRGEKTVILKPESFRQLQTPAGGETYAKGWVILDRDWAKGKALYHNGSNTSWMAVAWLAPSQNVAFLAVTNDGSGPAQKGCDEAIVAMIGIKGSTSATGAPKQASAR